MCSATPASKPRTGLSRAASLSASIGWRFLCRPGQTTSLLDFTHTRRASWLWGESREFAAALLSAWEGSVNNTPVGGLLVSAVSTHPLPAPFSQITHTFQPGRGEFVYSLEGGAVLFIRHASTLPRTCHRIRRSI